MKTTNSMKKYLTLLLLAVVSAAAGAAETGHFHFCESMGVQHEEAVV